MDEGNTYFNLAFMRAVTLSVEKNGPPVRISSARDTLLKMSLMSVTLVMTFCMDPPARACDDVLTSASKLGTFSLNSLRVSL